MPAAPDSVQMAWDVLQLSPGSNKQMIAGGVTQSTPDELTEKSSHQLRANLEHLVRSRAKEAGLKEVDKMFVVDIKLLSAPPGRGRQFPHWDHERGTKSEKMYTFLLCCTNGCYSTALPTFEFDERLAYSTDPEEMRQVAHRVSDTPVNFHSAPMNVGDIIIFQHTLPHYGVANTMPTGNRQLLFCVLSDTPEWGQDVEQVSPWLFVGAAFGWTSKEFAESLHENRKHSPLDRILSDQG
ncbi:MAG: hypothetical protein P4L99_02875, partial [Chthoniobacter sp.]|nr:hypothetical protein [Chthoniobacter sp.]